MPEKQILTRTELYEKVWKKSMIQLAKEFGISDRGLAKICKKYDIPRPGLGYWAKLEFGKKVKREPLPSNTELDKASITINPFSSFVLSQQERKRLVYLKSPIPITTDLTDAKLHPTVAKVFKKELRSLRKGYYTIKRTCFDISVSEGSAQRALMLIDTIIKALENRGHRFEIITEEKDNYDGSKSEIKHCYFKIKGEKVTFSIGEKVVDSNRTDMKSNGENKPEYIGMLKFIALAAYHEKYTWVETRTKRIEEKVPLIIKGILKAADSFKKMRIKAKHREIREAKERQIALEKEMQLRKEQENINNLMSQIDNWKKARSIRSYLRAAELFVIQEYKGYDKDSEFDKWLVWAYNYANRIDPLVQKS
jgi:hypothetical protein